MSFENKVTYKEVLTEQELQQVHSLEAQGAKKGIHYKIDLAINGGIINSRNGEVIGFMTVDSFGGDEIESAAITESETDWDAMAAELIAFGKEKKVKQILFIAAPEDSLVTEKLKSKGLISSFTEYRMAFDPVSFSPAPINEISVRQAQKADCDYIISLDRESFEGAATEINTCDVDNSYIIMRNNQPVGKLRIDKSGETNGLYGLVVESRLRGQGIGGQALTLILNKLIDNRAQYIFLEVNSENPGAYHLYKKLGFKTTSEFHYYPYTLLY